MYRVALTAAVVALLSVGRTAAGAETALTPKDLLRTAVDRAGGGYVHISVGPDG